MTFLVGIEKRKDGSVANILIHQLGIGITLLYHIPSRFAVG